jgi:2-polyprenyl-3-methyl-5-hydroxy-6-metoxy-1,4-benzoquinol methylase
MTVDNKKSKEIVQKVVADVGGAFTVGLAYIGSKLGLFNALAANHRCSSVELANESNLGERYVREWLKGMTAAEYIEHDSDSNTYFMTPEQKTVFCEEGSPFFAGGAFHFTLPSLLHTPAIMEKFQSGGGISYEELGEEIADSIDKMHRPWFEHLLIKEWLTGIPGLVDRLNKGISVLDVGCGLGRSTTAMAAAFPESNIMGVDPHGQSITKAQDLAAARGVTNARFSVTTLEELQPETSYDLIMAFDCIHDMKDPVGALRTITVLLAEHGLFLWSEPTGSHNPLENRTPLGKMRANLSPFHCLTVSLAAGGAGLGTIIGEKGARRLAQEAGFAHFEKFEIDSPVQQFFGLKNRTQGES